MMAKQGLGGETKEAEIRRLACIKGVSIIYQDSEAPVIIEHLKKYFGKDTEKILDAILGELEKFSYAVLILHINDPEKKENNINSFLYVGERDWGK